MMRKRWLCPSLALLMILQVPAGLADPGHDPYGLLEFHAVPDGWPGPDVRWSAAAFGDPIQVLPYGDGSRILVGEHGLVRIVSNATRPEWAFTVGDIDHVQLFDHREDGDLDVMVGKGFPRLTASERGLKQEGLGPRWAEVDDHAPSLVVLDGMTGRIEWDGFAGGSGFVDWHMAPASGDEGPWVVGQTRDGAATGVRLDGTVVWRSESGVVNAGTQLKGRPQWIGSAFLDLDGDDVPDMLNSIARDPDALRERTGETARFSVQAWSGKDGGLLWESDLDVASAAVAGLAIQGFQFVGLGDVDGDGIDDAAMKTDLHWEYGRSLWRDTAEDGLLVLSGADGRILVYDRPEDVPSERLLAVVDMDNDQRMELVTYAPGKPSGGSSTAHIVVREQAPFGLESTVLERWEVIVPNVPVLERLSACTCPAGESQVVFAISGSRGDDTGLHSSMLRITSDGVEELHGGQGVISVLGGQGIGRPWVWDDELAVRPWDGPDAEALSYSRWWGTLKPLGLVTGQGVDRAEVTFHAPGRFVWLDAATGAVTRTVGVPFGSDALHSVESAGRHYAVVVPPTPWAAEGFPRDVGQVHIHDISDGSLYASVDRRGLAAEGYTWPEIVEVDGRPGPEVMFRCACHPKGDDTDLGFMDARTGEVGGYVPDWALGEEWKRPDVKVTRSAAGEYLFQLDAERVDSEEVRLVAFVRPGEPDVDRRFATENRGLQEVLLGDTLLRREQTLDADENFLTLYDDVGETHAWRQELSFFSTVSVVGIGDEGGLGLIAVDLDVDIFGQFGSDDWQWTWRVLRAPDLRTAPSVVFEYEIDVETDEGFLADHSAVRALYPTQPIPMHDLDGDGQDEHLVGCLTRGVGVRASTWVDWVTPSSSTKDGCGLHGVSSDRDIRPELLVAAPVRVLGSVGLQGGAGVLVSEPPGRFHLLAYDDAPRGAPKFDTNQGGPESAPNGTSTDSGAMGDPADPEGSSSRRVPALAPQVFVAALGALYWLRRTWHRRFD